MKNVKTYSVLEVVAASIACVNVHGFVAKKDATASAPSTASRVQTYILNSEPSEISENLQHLFADAAELIEWAKENLRGDFGYTIKQMIEKGAVTLPQIAFLVTLPNQKTLSEQREVVAQQKAELTKDSEWFGSLRKRDKFFVKLVEKKFVDRFGSYIYNITTREGNIGSFFSQNNFDINVNDCFIMKATPKRHIVSSWHGGKETQFNRVVIEEVIGQKGA